MKLAIEPRDHEEACMLSVAIRAAMDREPHWNRTKLHYLLAAAEDCVRHFEDQAENSEIREDRHRNRFSPASA